MRNIINRSTTSISSFEGGIHLQIYHFSEIFAIFQSNQHVTNLTPPFSYLYLNTLNPLSLFDGGK